MLGALKIDSVMKRVFGSSNDRRLKGYRPKIAAINALEPEFEALTDEQLRAKTEELRAEVAAGKTLDDICAPAFAAVREAAKRTLKQRHFDVQLIGGLVLHEGAIAEMKTGEGKTLVATCAVYLNALNGEGVHVITVNDYLARRDSDWMGQIYKFLGLTVGVIVHGLDDDERRAAYAADVTYGTNNEFGFDYLRDNMKYDMSQMVQRGHAYAIVDEVDSILVDEARTPLIISGPSEDRSGLYAAVDTIIPKLMKEDFELDEKQRTVNLTEAGNEHAEALLREIGAMKEEGSLYEAGNATLVHHVNQALRAHKLFQRDKYYIVRNGEVVIVDEFTGRMMPGRRYSGGLHQALEAREHVTVQPENVTLASITFQNYFRLYKKLAGMTGTASTEADEFAEIYKLVVVEIPTNVPVTRADEDDEVYRTTDEKTRAIMRESEDANAKLQPMLVGTTSIEKSEALAEVLERKGYKKIDFAQPAALKPLYAAARSGKPSKTFAVLNARFHEQEAPIVAEAGVPGAITIATNMAGRGTDIQLGGNIDMRIRQEIDPNGSPEERTAKEAEIRAEVAELKQKAVDAGGLYIIGTERHESRRIDNQLRGRAGRQGDPGSSRFYLSLEDDLLRIFAGERISKIMHRLGMEEGVPIESRLISKRIEAAQKAVEAQNFESRKHLLEYDDVMNKQRETIYGLRRQLLEGGDQKDYVLTAADGVVDWVITNYCPKEQPAQEWNVDALRKEFWTRFGIDLRVYQDLKFEPRTLADATEKLKQIVRERYQERENVWTPERMRQHERMIMLQVVDSQWKDHLLAMDHLKEGIGLRGYGQKDPVVEYKRESYDMFEAMMDRIEDEMLRYLFLLRTPEEEEEMIRAYQRRKRREQAEMRMVGAGAAEKPQQVIRREKIGRNDPCPCGSGKKYKKCHGAALPPAGGKPGADDRPSPTT